MPREDEKSSAKKMGPQFFDLTAIRSFNRGLGIMEPIRTNFILS